MTTVIHTELQKEELLVANKYTLFAGQVSLHCKNYAYFFTSTEQLCSVSLQLNFLDNFILSSQL